MFIVLRENTRLAWLQEYFLILFNDFPDSQMCDVCAVRCWQRVMNQEWEEYVHPETGLLLGDVMFQPLLGFVNPAFHSLTMLCCNQDIWHSPIIWCSRIVIYIYIYIYVHTYIYIYVYMYICNYIIYIYICIWYFPGGQSLSHFMMIIAQNWMMDDGNVSKKHIYLIIYIYIYIHTCLLCIL